MINSNELERRQTCIESLLEEGLLPLKVLSRSGNSVLPVSPVRILSEITPHGVHKRWGGTLVWRRIMCNLLCRVLNSLQLAGLVIVIGAWHRPFFQILPLKGLEALLSRVETTPRGLLGQFSRKVIWQQVSGVLPSPPLCVDRVRGLLVDINFGTAAFF